MPIVKEIIPSTISVTEAQSNGGLIIRERSGREDSARQMILMVLSRTGMPNQREAS
jgi:hypothetical protein